MSEQLLSVLNGRYAYAPTMSEQLLTVLNGRYAYAPMLSGNKLLSGKEGVIFSSTASLPYGPLNIAICAYAV